VASSFSCGKLDGIENAGGHKKMEKKRYKNYNLNVTIMLNRKDGTTLTVSTLCSQWRLVKKFIKDFERNIQPRTNGKT